MKNRLLALVLCLSCLLAPGALAASEEATEKAEVLVYLDYLISTYSLSGSEHPLQDALAELITRDPALFDKIVAELYKPLDKYSRYLTLEQYQQDYPAGAPFVGIGITVDAARTEGIFVESVVAGGEAEKAGMKQGDRIIRVEGADVTFFPWQELRGFLQGEVGSKVAVTVLRDGKEVELKIKRTVLQGSNISSRTLSGNVGYISIARFGSAQDYFDFASIWENMPYDGIRSVIIDLRGNPGGDVDVMYNIENYIVPDAGRALFTLKGRDSMDYEFFTSTGAGFWKPNKLLILVDQYSASAAEMMAGSLQMLGYAELVGVTTYGKGQGQAVFGLTEDTLTVLTYSEALLPDLTSYHGKGIVPKHKVALEQRAYPMPEISPMAVSSALLPTARGGRVLGLEQRLSLLGYFNGTADESFTPYTRWCVNAFQRDLKLPETSYVSTENLRALESETDKLKSRQVWYDTQLDFAYETAAEAAKQPLSGKLPPRSIEEAMGQSR